MNYHRAHIIGILHAVCALPYPGEFPEVNTTRLSILSDEYIVDQHVASGSSTRVFRASRLSAHVSSLPEIVAVKCIRSDSPHLLSKPEREYRILRKLPKTPGLHIPEAFYLSPQWTCGKQSRCQFLVMTLGGPDLDRVVSKGIIPIEKAKLGPTVGHFESFVATIGLSLVQALDIMHSNGIVHGDIGTNNVALPLSLEPHLFLIDFGQAKTKDELSENKFQQSRIRDIRRTKHMLLRLLRMKLRQEDKSMHEQQFHRNRLFSLLFESSEEINVLKKVLQDFLERELHLKYYGSVIW